MVRAADVKPGMSVDIPADVVKGTDNEQIQPYEYALIEAVSGRGTAWRGWADGMAGPGQVVLYTTNFAVPILIDAERPLLAFVDTTEALVVVSDISE